MGVKSWKNKQYSLLWNAGGMPADGANTTHFHTRGAGKKQGTVEIVWSTFKTYYTFKMYCVAVIRP